MLSRTAEFAERDASGSIRHLWREVNNLLHPIATSPVLPTTHDWSQKLAEYFQAKVSEIKLQISSLADRIFGCESPLCSKPSSWLSEVAPVTAEQVEGIL